MAVTPQETDVEKILTGLMSKNSGLMKQAKTQGLQGAQQAGLGQSTMGIQAAQAAAYNAAMPIASQQAQQGQQTNMQTSQFGHETGLQAAGFTHAASQAELDRSQQLFQMYEQAGLERTNDRDRQATAAGYQREAYTHEANMKALDRSTQERLAAMEISTANRQQAANAYAANEQSMATLFSQIAQNENLPAAVRDHYLTYATNIRNSNTEMISALFRSADVIPW